MDMAVEIRALMDELVLTADENLRGRGFEDVPMKVMVAGSAAAFGVLILHGRIAPDVSAAHAALSGTLIRDWLDRQADNGDNATLAGLDFDEPTV